MPNLILWRARCRAFVFIGLAACGLAWAQEGTPTQILRPVGGFVEPGEPMTPGAAANSGLLRPFEGELGEAPHGAKALWFRIRVKGGAGGPMGLRLGQANPRLVQVYLREGEGYVLQFEGSGTWPFHRRPVALRHLVVPVEAVPGEMQELWIRVVTDGAPFRCTFRLQPLAELLQEGQRETLGFGMVEGGLLLAIVFSLFLLAATKESLHAWFALFALGAGLYIASATGFGYQFLWPDHPDLNRFMRGVTGAFTFAMNLQFMGHFLGWERGSRLSRWARATQVGYGLLTLFYFGGRALSSAPWVDHASSLPLHLLHASALGVLVTGLIRGCLARNPSATLGLLAILPPSAMAAFIMARRFWPGTVPFEPTALLPWTLLWEVILLSLGLALRYQRYRDEKAHLEVVLAQKDRELAERVLAAQEEEKRRLSEDLHDDLGGTLAAIRGMLSGLPVPPDPDTSRRLQEAQHILDRACTDLRRMAHDLMPADWAHTTLAQALEAQVDRANWDIGGPRYHFLATGDASGLEPKAALVLYRMASELLNNARKYARATQVHLQLFCTDEGLTLTVEDDGQGFGRDQADSGGLGLRDFKSRAEYIGARWHLESSSRGSFASIHVPRRSNS